MDRLPITLVVRAVLLSVVLIALAAIPAAANPLLPPAGKVFSGVASGDDISDFTARTGRHPAVWEHWIQWGQSFGYALDRSQAARTRAMLHLSTAASQNAPGRISPGAIARGAGDAYLVRVNGWLAAYGAPVYLRLFAEMNNCDLAYSSYDCDGRRRDADHSPARFKQAWRRIVTVVRGGGVAAIDARLRALGLPPLHADSAELPRPQVAFLWSPMTAGSPDIPALSAQVYWPGARWVDWVATSFYSKFPTFDYLEPFYRAFALRYAKPFAFGEWAMWGADAPGFASRLFGWIRGHDRVRMVVYNQGQNPAGPFRLRRFPRAQRVIRQALAGARFSSLAPEFAP